MTNCTRWTAFAFLAIIAGGAAAQKDERVPTQVDESAVESPLNLDPAKEQSIVKRLYASADEPEAALAAMQELPTPPTELELRALRNLDREIGKSENPIHRQIVEQSVLAMALSGDPTTLQYLHKVFDSQPARRASIANGIAQFALAKQRRAHDWPLLVRSLTTVKDEQAVNVLKALARFRERGTNPTVQRNVLLAGLQLSDERAAALKLLEYWTGAHPAQAKDPMDGQLADWQRWYHEKYPTLPEAKLPIEDQAAPHRFAILMTFLQGPAGRNGDPAKGEVLFERTLCIKCHQFGDRGERIGPDLTKVSQRLTTEEIVQSLLFPSHQILDQYATKEVELVDGRIITGIVGESGDSLAILPADAKKLVVPKKEIAAIRDSPVSAMPAGLLDKLNRPEIADLMAFLGKAPE